MSNRCCVPNCDSGYTYKKGHEEKVTVFTTKDKKLQQKWTKLIQRKNYRVSDKSYVCANHFCDEDIVKGTTQIVGGKEHFTPKNWVLKEGACPTIFQSLYCICCQV